MRPSDYAKILLDAMKRKGEELPWFFNEDPSPFLSELVTLKNVRNKALHSHESVSMADIIDTYQKTVYWIVEFMNSFNPFDYSGDDGDDGNDDEEEGEEKEESSPKEERLEIDIPGFVTRFLASGQRARYHKEDFPLAYQSRQLGREEYAKLFDHLKNNQETIQILTGYQKRLEEREALDDGDNGLYDDFTYLVCGPIKLMEKMLKHEIYNHYRDIARQVRLDTKTSRGKKSPLRIDSDKQNPTPEEAYPNMTITASVLTLRDALILSHKELPWFFAPEATPEEDVLALSSFIDTFANKIRNNKFHTGIIRDLQTGKEVYNETAYWFVEFLSVFSPFEANAEQ